MTMKAILFEHGGPAAVLSYEEIEVPKPIEGEALIEVHACGINRIDLDLRSEIDDEMPMPHILGSDIAGVVRAYGPSAKGPAVGSRVLVSPAIPIEGSKRCKIIGYQTQGGYAQFAAVPAANLLPLPADLTFVGAATLPLSGMTAHHALFDHGGLRGGERVLVTGGTSGVGVLAVQMALAAGCQVTSTAGASDRLTWLSDLGVHKVVNHAEDNLGAQIQEYGPYDVIFDHIGGDVLGGIIPSVAEGGRIVAIGYTRGDQVTFSLFDLFRGQISISGSYMGDLANLECVLRMVENGRVKPVVERVLSLGDAMEAHKILESRQFIGKIVLDTTGVS